MQVVVILLENGWAFALFKSYKMTYSSKAKILTISYPTLCYLGEKKKKKKIKKKDKSFLNELTGILVVWSNCYLFFFFLNSKRQRGVQPMYTRLFVIYSVKN